MMPANIIPHDTAELLTKLCGMFGSDFEGERSNAARMANELVRSVGLTWGDLILPSPGLTNTGNRKWAEPETIREMVMICLLFQEPLTDWEVDFLKSIAARLILSTKQQATLDHILDKSRGFARVAEAA